MIRAHLHFRVENPARAVRFFHFQIHPENCAGNPFPWKERIPRALFMDRDLPDIVHAPCAELRPFERGKGSGLGKVFILRFDPERNIRESLFGEIQEHSVYA